MNEVRLPSQTFNGPVKESIEPISESTVTVNIWDAEVPHALFTETEISPPVIPDVTSIELVVDVPVHPEGSVQL